MAHMDLQNTKHDLCWTRWIHSLPWQTTTDEGDKILLDEYHATVKGHIVTFETDEDMAIFLLTWNSNK